MTGFRHMQAQKGTIHFNKLCTQMATDYALSDNTKTGKYFADRKGISESCFWQMIYHAVEYCLVDDEIVDMMEQKASENLKQFDGSGMRSKQHYEKLREKRRLFVYKVAIRFARNVIAHEGKSFRYFLEEYERNEESFVKLLELAMKRAKYYGISQRHVKAINKGLEDRKKGTQMSLF